ncbi:LPD1 domain-containing protein [Alteromonas sp. CYL-A6]|uniref:LPD1 domain-containing protein n=1 Tax=Alteromonas nitratireducens TaxID=3390813 RepID=UPI0034B727CD
MVFVFFTGLHLNFKPMFINVFNHSITDNIQKNGVYKFPAFDHYIADKVFTNTGPGAFASQSWLDDAVVREHPLNQRLCDCFRLMFLDEKHAPNAYLLRSIEADRALKLYYYARPQEMAARAFEACIQDAPIKNAFLVQGTKKTTEARLGIYPRDTLRNKLNDALMVYFYQLGIALTSKS